MSKALSDLRSQLEDIEANLRFVDLASRLRPRLGNVVNWQAVSEETGLAKEFMNCKDTRPESIYASMLIRLIAALERYVRRLMEVALVEHTKKASSYSALPEHIRLRNTALSGHLLAAVESPRAHFEIDFGMLVTNLATCAPTNANYQLNISAFAAAVTGASPPAIEKALGNVGVRDWWDKLGSAATLEKLLGTRGPRATGKASRDKLEELSRWRNYLAHGGDEEPLVSAQQLRDGIGFVQAFADSLEVAVVSHLTVGAG